MTPTLFALTAVIIMTAVFGLLARLLRQPLILAYIVVGLLVGYLGYADLIQKDTFQLFSELGIMLLLFLVGLEINYASIRLVGKAATIVGLGQIIFTFIIGFGIALLFNFSYLASAYIAIALTFSSTIIIVKLLSEKKDLHSLYGRITVGFMLIQDFMAILLLIVLSGIQAGHGINGIDLALTVIKGVSLFAVVIFLGRTVFPHIFDRVARTPELLFAISLAWVFFVVMIVAKLGFSIEVAGFLAGLALANSSERFQIATKIKPLRDFFIMLFFIILGTHMVGFSFAGLAWPVIVFSIFVIIGNPLIVLLIMGALGYRKRTSFLTGVTIAQVSEFSLILAAVGARLEHIDKPVVGLITAVGIITIAISSYLIMHADTLYIFFSRVLSIFERSKTKEIKVPRGSYAKRIILVGGHRTGTAILQHFSKEDVVVIDFDPEVIERLRFQGYDCILGDASDIDIFDQIDLKKARVIISTSPDFTDNMMLLEELKIIDGGLKVIMRAETVKDARLLYKKGADYVMLPHLTSGNYLGRMLSKDNFEEVLAKLGKRENQLIEQGLVS